MVFQVQRLLITFDSKPSSRVPESHVFSLQKRKENGEFYTGFLLSRPVNSVHNLLSHFIVQNLVAWAHQTAGQPGKCGPAICPGRRGYRFGEQLAGFWLLMLSLCFFSSLKN